MKIRLALNELAKTTYKAIQPLQLVLQGPGRKFRGRRELGILFLSMQGSDNYFPRNCLHHCVRRRSRRRERPKLHQARPTGLLDRRLPLRAPQPVAHGCRHAVSRTRLLCSHHGARQALTLARGAHTDNSMVSSEESDSYTGTYEKYDMKNKSRKRSRKQADISSDDDSEWFSPAEKKKSTRSSLSKKIERSTSTKSASRSKRTVISLNLSDEENNFNTLDKNIKQTLIAFKKKQNINKLSICFT
ncbi:unnamed protein product [Trichogramma brassicae]|uniref:Uncharacterized protein n=1 Tax=Trichogramma brassicae TaxID=86971 RepID=A0A6H5ILZ3_9HYME|nr:unnamed protein product [Trichogramma brassicae]